MLLSLKGRATPILGSGYGGSAAWSPDGRTIVYSRSQNTTFGAGFQGLWLVHPDGSALRQLTSGTQSRPAWSPDGKRILFTEIRVDIPERSPFAVGYTDVATGAQTPLARDDRYNDAAPSWSPDGSLVVFSRGPITGANPCGSLWVVGADGSNPHAVTQDVYPCGTGSWKPR